MKQWMYGVIGAIVGGFVLYLAQDWYSSRAKHAEHRVHFEASNAPISLSDLDIQKVSHYYAANHTAEKLVFISIIATNDGTDDISDKSFSIPIRDVIAFNNNELPNNKDDTTTLTYKDGNFKVLYKLLPRGTVHRFWILVPPLASIIRPQFTADQAETVATNKPEFDDEFPWWWLGTAGGALIISFFSFALGHASLESRLEKKGWKLKDLLEQSS